MMMTQLTFLKMKLDDGKPFHKLLLLEQSPLDKLLLRDSDLIDCFLLDNRKGLNSITIRLLIQQTAAGCNL